MDLSLLTSKDLQEEGNPFRKIFYIIMSQISQGYDDSYHGNGRCARKNESRGMRIFLDPIVERNPANPDERLSEKFLE
jgi:hypothetical protein